MALFTSQQKTGIEAAIAQEMTKTQQETKSLYLDIAGLETVEESPDRYVYRLMLASPRNFMAEQSLSFRMRGGVAIDAVIVTYSDDEVVVATTQKLSPEAIVDIVSAPSFILARLNAFLDDKNANAGDLARMVMDGALPAMTSPPSCPLVPGVNEDQQRAIEAMLDSRLPIYFLLGPPGTGKTMTLGKTVAKWLDLGKRILLVSTSNAAVDVAMLAVLQNLSDVAGQMNRLVRLGTSLHPEVRKLIATVRPDTGLVGCTLAKMVLDETVAIRTFDIVVIDEVSMVPLAYAVAATTLAAVKIVFSGDPQQLPPICQSNSAEALYWFGQNIYHWFNIGNYSNIENLPATMLRTQYRMTNQIGTLVSRLSYEDKLIHGRNQQGGTVEFVDMPPEWRKTFYSVREHSYYHPFTLPLMSEIVHLFAGQGEFLFLTPFKAQQALFTSLAFELRRRYPEGRFNASTIHRAQGSEREIVILDLTAYDESHIVEFFKNSDSEKLINVAISRARDDLFVIGSIPLLQALAELNSFWRNLLEELTARHIKYEKAVDFLQPVSAAQFVKECSRQERKSLPALYCCSHLQEPSEELIAQLIALETPRKLLVCPKTSIETVLASRKKKRFKDLILRASNKSLHLPAMFFGNGYLGLAWQDSWVCLDSENVCRTLWKIGFSHMADEEVNPADMRCFQCSRCEQELVVHRDAGEYWLMCPQCRYRRVLSLREARIKVRLLRMTCSKGHPLTARESKTGIFISCENAPDFCDYHESLRIIEGF